MITRIEVDFNDRDEQGMIPASPADAEGPLRRGAWVDAFDDEGNQCLVTVVKVTPDMASLVPNWNTFIEPGESRVLIAGADYQSPLTVSLFPQSRVARSGAAQRA